MSGYTPSTYQQAVYDWVRTGVGNAFVNAVAGAGKSSCLVGACEYMMGDVVFLAFNRDIANELKQRVAHMPSVKAATFHAIGWQAWRKLYPNCTVDADGKTKHTTQNVPRDYYKAVVELVSMAKQSGVGVVWDRDDLDKWYEIIDHYGIDAADDGKLIEYTLEVLDWGYRVGCEVVDYDDMLWLPLVDKVELTKYDWVLVDEVNDSNQVRRLFVRAMMHEDSRALFVGDPNQCQPPGTVVATAVRRSTGKPNGRSDVVMKPIEDVRVGDMVISYEPGDYAFVANGRLVEETASRDYTGELVVVETNNGLVSKYTPNHKCLVNFVGLRSCWAVYMMRRGNQYRMGKCKMDYTHMSGVSARMRHERADAAWIMELHEDEQVAFFREQAISGRFGIPQLMFTYEKMHRDMAHVLLDETWEFIGDNSERGEECLRWFGRDPLYPLFTSTSTKQQTVKRPCITEACNIMDGCLVLPWAGRKSDVHARKSDWAPVKVSREDYTGKVYSLKVAGSKMYVADGIVTHNCIYGFAGASSDACERVVEDFNCTTLPLSLTYRVSKAATELAQRFVPHITAADTNKQGLVKSISDDQFRAALPNMKPGDAILCRKVRPLIATALHLIRLGVPCHVEGKDIGASVTGIINRLKAVDIVDLRTKLSKWRDAEIMRVYERYRQSMEFTLLADEVDDGAPVGSGFNGYEIELPPAGERAIERLNEQFDTVLAVIEGCESIADIHLRIRHLFATTKPGEPARGVTLSTVHKAKGREWSRVYVLGYYGYMPSTRATKDWEVQQEMNLMYVAVTRTKDELYLTAVDVDKD